MSESQLNLAFFVYLFDLSYVEFNFAFALFTFQTKKKRKRCGECIGCQKKDNCGDCAPCRNDKSHQICKQRRCEKLTDKKVSTIRLIKFVFIASIHEQLIGTIQC